MSVLRITKPHLRSIRLTVILHIRCYRFPITGASLGITSLNINNSIRISLGKWEAGLTIRAYRVSFGKYVAVI